MGSFREGWAIGWATATLAVFSVSASAQVNVLTHRYDLARTGANLAETTLRPSNVNITQFGKLFSYAVDGYVYAQPLYVSNLSIPGKGTHNVLFVATQHNSVYAFDADTPTGLLWHVNLGPSAATPNNDFGNRYGPFVDIIPEVGITGTPVIDPVSQTLYVDAFTHEGTSYFHRLHALNIVDGSERPNSPVLVTASVSGVGVDSSNGKVVFNPKQQLQRCALALAGNVVYICYASYGDTDPFHGWIIGYDKTSLQQLPSYTFNSTPNSTSTSSGGVSQPGEGGIWMTGSAPAIDAASNLYVATGNGVLNANLAGGTEYGNSLLKFSTSNGLGLSDWFAPFEQATLESMDRDFGSGGPMLLPDQPGSNPHLLVLGSKGGKIYLINRDQLTSDNKHYNGGGSTDHIVQSITITSVDTPWCFDTPAYFNGRVYFIGRNDVAKAFALTNGLLSTSPVSQSFRNYAFPGAVPSISANSSTNGILWTEQRIDSNSPAVLVAYDATDLSTELYASNAAANNRDQLANVVRYAVPVVANGKVYLGGQYAVSVLGLLPATPTPTPHALPLQNGNFETAPTNVRAQIPGWMVSGPEHIMAQSIEGYTSASNSATFSESGDFTGDTLTQSFIATPGAVYKLQFSAGVFGVASGSPLQLRARVTGSATNLDQTVTPLAANTFTGSNVIFQTYTYTFTADSGTETLSFTMPTPNNPNADVSLDDVSITLVSTPSPTPTLTATPTPTPTATPTPHGLPLNNGNFETAPANVRGQIPGWVVSGPGHVKAQNEGYTSPSNSCTFSEGGDYSGDAISQQFTAIPGTVYAVTFQAGVFGVRSGNPQTLRVQVTGKTTNLDVNVTPPEVDTYTPSAVKFQGYSFSFTADNTTETLKVTDTGTANANADVVVDDVAVTVGAAPTPTLPLVNGSFETTPINVRGSIPGWTVSGPGHVMAQNEGFTSAFNSCTFSEAGDYTGDAISQQFNAVPGTVYTVTFQAGIFGIRSGNPQTLRVQVTGNATNLDVTVTPPEVGTYTPSVVKFQQYSFNFTADNTVETLKLTDTGTANPNADMVVDDVSVH
jgi:hypothetical protein